MPATTTVAPLPEPEAQTQVSLWSRIGEAITNTGSLDDHVITDLVILNMTDDERYLALFPLVRDAVQRVRNNQTRTATKAIVPDPYAAKLPSVASPSAPATKGSGKSQTQPANVVVGASAQTLRVRKRWEAWIATTLPTGDGRRIFIEDATVADLRRASEVRRKQAEAILVDADRWDRIADTLAASGLQRVGDLPPQII
ncbi:MAG TPA: hypothetical protein VFU07_05335 [Candidatus Lumbricidophila sp.]|nr:hypothetical protein [Candidatus Lumbricidophila sp.]